MSTPVPCRDCFSLGANTIGFGVDFEKLQRIYDDTVDRLRESETLGRALKKVLISLDEIYQECNVPNWDGYGALPITRGAVSEAEKFLKLLPSNIPMPEIVPEPGGEIALEWRRDRHRIFIISLSGDNEIVYAGKFGLNRVRGKEYFVNSIPRNVITDLLRL